MLPSVVLDILANIPLFWTFAPHCPLPLVRTIESKRMPFTAVLKQELASESPGELVQTQTVGLTS